MVETADVVVVGAGVVGSSVAHYLTLAGAKVRILEREAIGGGDSAHATGFLSMLGSEFSEGPSFQFAQAAYDEFADLVPRLEETTGVDLLLQRRPSLRIALDEDEETLIKSQMVWQGQSLPLRWIDGDDVRRIDPRISHRVRGAAYQDESAQLDSYRLNLALARSAELGGTEISLREVTGLLTSGDRVTGVRTLGGLHSCDMVVVAAGAWSAVFGDWLGHSVPVRPLKGERLMLRYDGPPLPVLISSPKRGHMISRLDGLLSIGSTGGRDYDHKKEGSVGVDSDRQPTEAARIELTQRAIDVVPELEATELVQHLAGTRPMSLDRKPIIGPVPGWDGVMLATGHTTKGIHLGPITGRVVADYVLHGRTDVPVEMEAFLLSRFGDHSDADFQERPTSRGVTHGPSNYPSSSAQRVEE